MIEFQLLSYRVSQLHDHMTMSALTGSVFSLDQNTVTITFSLITTHDHCKGMVADSEK